MSSEWYYDSPSTVAGTLQRGLGRGAALVRDPEDVMACVRRDHRFWWIFDDRALYLARLVRDLGIDAGRIVDVLRGEDDDNAVGNATQVLVQLGRGGDQVAIDGLREYVRRGADRVDELEEIAAAWPAELWDDLLPVAADRLRPGDMMGFATGEPGSAAGWRVDRVSNQSTGYCPDPECWPAVAAALDAAGTPHPGGFTDAVLFRRCTSCGQRNIVHDGDFACAVCDAPLPVDG
ncbi:hypothetical protein [Dactylosporangium sp. NPDC006015]|uniref:hypothetical protein n=1 Tax=Dactylosporangium sp. NPDC006015 TaxID=3154576 RepID=UPI0033BF3FEB